MPLSRLDNFLKNVKGNILYVDPNNLDSTDGIENQGNSLSRPFKTLQRALIEASRFSYQVGLDNDRFERTTIYLAPGEYQIDNRPGYIPTGSSQYVQRSGQTTGDFPAFSSTSNFDLNDSNNILYKFNSVFGGVIVPRGVSIVGQDLRKCKIKPLYVPNPENDLIERSSIFRLTGATYFFSFSVFDSPKSRGIYKDYTTNTFTGTFSHHKLTVFEFADGANPVNIDDEFLTYQTDRTDLDMYYEKIGLAYGASSGRNIQPDYPEAGVDIQPRIDEFRIVGPTAGTAGITSIKSGDAVTPNTTVTVETNSAIFGLNIDTNVIVTGVPDDAYNGTFSVTRVLAANEEGVTEFQYESATVPTNALPNPLGTTVDLSTDTVSSASPYVFSVSLRSVYGMCGMHADGSKADGFKSMVVAQFTGISLQLDDNAFVKYNSTSGTYEDRTTVENLHIDIDARYKPEYENYHIKASNNSFMQLVSVFGVGYAEHFRVESGGDFSLTNSNSNFGMRALRSDGFRDSAYEQDDYGYITQMIPPRFIEPETMTVEFFPIDVGVTTGVGDTSRAYIYGYKNADVRPPSLSEGYRFGAKTNDKLYAAFSVSGTITPFEARIIMPNTEYTDNEVSAKKVNTVGRTGLGNSITSSTLTFTEDHNLINGESIRVISDNGRLPDGLSANRLYYAITDGLSSDEIRIAQTLNDTSAGNEITINSFGGRLTVESRVNDKLPGEAGHPIQYDTSEGQWYVNVATASTENNLYGKIEDGVASLGESTPRTYLVRQPDNRSSLDRIYRMRCVIPASSATAARPPLPGYVIQESNDVTGASDTEVQYFYNTGSVTMNNDAQMRNFTFIANATFDNGISNYTTELPHNLSIGSKVKIENITSTNFPVVGAALSGYNGEFTVSGISSSLTFSVNTSSSDPGTFSNNTSVRTRSLPTMKRTSFDGSYYIYEVNEVDEFVLGEQDGVYDLIVKSSNNIPTIAPFSTSSYSLPQPTRNIFPQQDRDNPHSNPDAAICYALPDNLGEVVINNPENSLTRETIDQLYLDTRAGVALTDIQTTDVGFGITIFTSIDHGLNGITRVAISNGGGGYGNGTGSEEIFYNVKLDAIGGGSLGRNATAVVTVNASGQMSNIEIMNPGSSYVVGDTLGAVGIATTTGFSAATLEVNRILDNRGDTLQVEGIFDSNFTSFNKLYRIVNVEGTQGIGVTPVGGVSGIATLGVGADVVSRASARLVGHTLDVESFEYDKTTGIATVTTTQAHGFSVNNTVFIDGSTDDFYNGQAIIKETIGLTTFTSKIGINTITPDIAGVMKVHPAGLAAQGGDVGVITEDLEGRGKYGYAGITTTIVNGITTTTATVDITNLNRYNLQIGDYLKIDNEIVRIRTTVNDSGSNTQITVFRGVLGTNATNHVAGSVVQRVGVYPIELRRNSIIRASGHTFEYIGYGPGNYSTAFPSKQTKQLSPTEQLNAQSLETNAGINNYTGMNDAGDYYIGNKKISSNSGKEQVFKTPIQTIAGEDPYSRSSSEKDLGLNYVDSDKLTVSRSVIVDGGDSNEILSEFNGPVSFSKKISSTSSEGIEANCLFIQGSALISRKITVGISTPSQSGNPGDIVYNANPENGGSVGWVYTINNEWKTFGDISS